MQAMYSFSPLSFVFSLHFFSNSFDSVSDMLAAVSFEGKIEKAHRAGM